MQKYYKIIDETLPFLTAYDIPKADEVPLFKTFSAIDPGTNDGFYIHAQEPVLHFCDNAFDTMLWHSACIVKPEEAFIYEIKPIGNITKQKCTDDTGLYQCGSPKIQFITKVDIDTMFQRALLEFEANREAKIRMYPNLRMPKIIHFWLRHQQSKYVY